MKEIPILFSTPMVEAILDGRKTKTRREVKHRISYEANQTGRTDLEAFGLLDKRGNYIEVEEDSPATLADGFCPYGKPGDILWVRETIHQEGELGLEYVAGGEPIDEIIIPDDYGPYGGSYSFRSIPSIHMPKWAVRIWLEVTDVRVERLQDITEEDAIAEGIENSMSGNGRVVWKHYTKDKWGPSPVHSFETLWRSINGEESWPSNPWVWVVSFKVLSTNGKPYQNGTGL